MSSKSRTARKEEARVRQLRLRREELTLEREIRTMEAQNKSQSMGIAAESMSRYFGINDYVDPAEWMTDSFGSPTYAYYGMTETRQEGKNRPFVENEQDLIEMRGFARMMVELNPYLKGVLENLTNYVIGTGFVYTAVPRKQRDVPPELVNLVQDVIDEFDEENMWCGNAEREIFKRGCRDGEAPIRIHHVGNGRCKFRIIEPEFIRQPYGNVRQLEEYLANTYPRLMDWWSESSSWTFGVHTTERDIEEHLGYFAEWNPGGSDWEYILAKDVVFIRSNVDRNVKRGMSDFYPVEGLSDRAIKLCRNIATGASVQAAIAYIEEFEQGVSAANIGNMGEEAAEFNERRKNPNGSTTSTNVSTLGEGTALKIPKGRSYHAGPMGQSSAPVYLDVLQGVLRAIGTRWSMPEYMISGDASNGNYASSVVAGSPFVKACEASQFYYRTYFRKVYWKALEYAFYAGKFKGFVNSFAELKRLIEVDVSVPDVEVRDPQKETDRRKLMWECGGLSMKTWMSQEGEDYDQERANIEAEKTDGIVTTPDIIPGSPVSVPAELGATGENVTAAPAEGVLSAEPRSDVGDMPAVEPSVTESGRSIVKEILSEIFAEEEYP